MRRIITTVLGLALPTTACGGSASPDEEYVSLPTDHFLAGSAESGGLAFTAASAACTAEAIVADFGADGLADLGYDPASGGVPNFDAIGPGDGGDADARWFDHIDGCIDIAGRVAAMFGDAGYGADVAECVAGAYYDSGLAEESLMATEYDAT